MVLGCLRLIHHAVVLGAILEASWTNNRAAGDSWWRLRGPAAPFTELTEIFEEKGGQTGTWTNVEKLVCSLS